MLPKFGLSVFLQIKALTFYAFLNAKLYFFFLFCGEHEHQLLLRSCNVFFENKTGNVIHVGNSSGRKHTPWTRFVSDFK
jgi:hypothetical protein